MMRSTKRTVPIIVACLLVAAVGSAQQFTISTVAGQLPLGIVPMAGNDVNIGGPGALALDAAGDVYFLTGTGGIYGAFQSLLIKLDRNGILTRIAGGAIGFTGDGGPALNATFSSPLGLAIDPMGNLYVADTGNGRIRKISPSGTITTIAGNGSAGYSGDGGQAVNAMLDGPGALAIDASGNLYVGVGGRIRMISPSGVITTIAGTGAAGYSGDGGPAVNAQLGSVQGLATDSAGNLYVADNLNGGDDSPPNSRLREISAKDGSINTIAGTGPIGFAADGSPAASAPLSLSGALTLDSQGNLYIADNQRIRRITNGIIATVAGNGGFGYSYDGISAVDAGVIIPAGMAADSSGNLYFTDSGYGRIRKLTESLVVTVAGNGAPFAIMQQASAAALASLAQPVGVAVNSAGAIIIADTWNDCVRLVSSQGLIDTIAGQLLAAGPLNDPALASSTFFFMPGGLATDSSGNLYVADSGDSRIRMIAPSGTVSTIAGASQASRPGFSGDGGLAVNALLSWPKDMALDGNGNIYIADTGNNRIRLVNPAGIISTIAGTGGVQFGGDQGPATSAQLNNPSGIAVDQSGNIYVADTGNFRVRKIAPSGVISTFAGSGIEGHSGDGGPAIQAQLGSPLGLKFDASGNLYIADGGSVRMVTPAGVITTVAGTGTVGFSGDGGPAASAQIGAWGLAFDAQGNLYVADPFNNVIHMLQRVTK